MSKDFRDAEVLLDVQNLKQYFGSMRASVKAVDDVSFSNGGCCSPCFTCV